MGGNVSDSDVHRTQLKLVTRHCQDQPDLGIGTTGLLS